MATEHLPATHKPPVLAVVYGLGAVILAVLATHTYLTRPISVPPTTPSEEISQVSDKPTQHAPGGIINNQSGGTSTNTVNNYGVSRPPRHLTDAIKAELLQKVPKTKQVTVGWAAGDGEAERFAMEIRAYLGANGYDLDAPTAALTAWEVKPIELNLDGPKTILTVGKNQ